MIGRDERAAWRKPKPAKEVLKGVKAPLDAAGLFLLLELAGLVEWKEYLSTSGSGEIKRFRRFTDAGLAYGVNEASAHPFATKCKFYWENFGDLLRIAAKTLTEFAVDLGAG